jgi:pimeloyl-ACP methyl ester carboxylesterase
MDNHGLFCCQAFRARADLPASKNKPQADPHIMQAQVGSAEASTVNVAGIDIEIWRHGAGRPVLFLHPGDGLDDSRAMLEDLARRFDVIAPSHPGFGRSSLPRSFRTVDDLAYFYLDFVEQQKLENFVLVGVSFGAWIAAELAIKSSSRLAGLVLADAVGAKFEGPKVREIADLFSVPQYEQQQYLYEAAARRRKNFAELSDETLVRLARNFESFALFGWSPTLHDPRLAGRLHRIDVPTLVLWGASDRVVSPDYGRAFAKRIAGAEFKLIEQAGHYAHVEQPAAFVDAVNRFAKALPATRAQSRN